MRERGLQEQIEREEAEALRRIEAGLGEIERKQLDQLKRIVERTGTSVSEAAAAQFESAIKASREEAARRLARELERAVDGFLRQAHGLLTDQMDKATDAAAAKIEHRADNAIAALERHRDAAIDSIERRGGREDARAERTRRLEEDLGCRLVPAAALHEIDRAVQVDLAVRETLRQARAGSRPR